MTTSPNPTELYAGVPEIAWQELITPDMTLAVDCSLWELYCQIADVMKKYCRGWTGYILTGNFELAKYIRLKEFLWQI